MDDDELRSALAAWLTPVQQMPVPDSLRLRRRARRRQRRTALVTTSALACAGAAAWAGLLVGQSPAPPMPLPPSIELPVPSSCTSQVLTARWLPPAHVTGSWPAPPPQTYRLALENIGTIPCSLKGWPHFVITGSRHPHSVSVAYQTHFDEWVGRSRTRIVKPTTIVLIPGGTVVAVVNVALPITQRSGCVTRAWLVRPPTPGATELRTRGDLPELCDGSHLTESPLYPPTVPITQNYP